MRWLFALWVLLCPAVSAAQSDASDRARAAAEMMDAAGEKLSEAEGARDRVRALTETIAAYEAGLSALRSGVREASVRQTQLSASLQSRDDEIAALLAVLMRSGSTQSPVFLLHPGGPMGTARAGMLVAVVAPALNAGAEDLRRDLLELQRLQSLQTDAATQLMNGLRDVQTARTALNQAIADRQDLPKRFVADPVREAILLASAETLDSFAADLDQISSDAVPDVPSAHKVEKGALDLPVQGRVLRRSGEPDAAGIVRPGIIVATLPQALVTSPFSATLRYAGPLLDFGQVMILEPEADVLFVFAGLETIYGETGDMIEVGAPLGLMGDGGDKNASELSTDGDDTGADRSETLYIEVREKNRPEDPSLWFRTDKDG